MNLANTAIRFLGILGLVCGISSDRLTAATLNVMSFNIRHASGFGSALSPPNGWFDINDLINGQPQTNGRRLRALAVIGANDPDLLGVQESILIQTDDLRSELSDYDYVGVGREDGVNQGEQNGIFYRRSRFTQRNSGHFWLSETPNAPGTTFATSFDSGNPRMVTWVMLNDLLTGSPLMVVNTHWSLNQSARQQSAALIRDRVFSLAGEIPMIVMGDLNTTETSPEFQLLRDGENSDDGLLVDAYRQVHPPSNQERTFHNYSGGTLGSRIDHILFSDRDFVALDATIDRTTYNGLYTSDHYPVTARLQIVPEPTALSLATGAAICVMALRRKRRSNDEAAQTTR